MRFSEYLKKGVAVSLAVLLWGSSILPAAAQSEVFPPPPDEEQEEPEAPRPTAPRSVPARTEAKPDNSPSAIKPEPPLTETAKAPVKKTAGRLSPELAKITIRLSDVPLSVFLRAVSQQTRVNFIISEGLENKKVTAFLEGVTLEEALGVLLGIKGLAYEKIPGKTHTYLITTRKETQPRTATRIFELSFIPLRDIEITELQGEDQSSVGTAGGSEEAQSGASAAQPAGQDIVGVITTMLSSFGRIAVDERTNSLIITDLPERFPEIDRLIRDLDKKSPQVSIESQIVEINSDGLQKMGLEFGGENGELVRFIGPSRYTDYLMRDGYDKDRKSFWTPFNTGQSYEAFSSPNAIPISAFDARSGVTFGVVSFSEFQILLRAIMTKTRGKLLARPRISTVNNKPAEIRVTRNEAIGTAAVVGNVGAAQSSVERQQTGLILRVTPQVNGDGYITLVIEPKLTRTVNSTVGIGVKDPITRAVKTMVRVKNGETIVLGGLMDTREERIVRKVPILGDIPIIGWILFRSWSTQKVNSELAIFLTPSIMEG